MGYPSKLTFQNARVLSLLYYTPYGLLLTVPTPRQTVTIKTKSRCFASPPSQSIQQHKISSLLILLIRRKFLAPANHRAILDRTPSRYSRQQVASFATCSDQTFSRS